jgi:hypothetical protein
MTTATVLLYLLGCAGNIGAIVVIGGSVCRLIAMQPGKTTKWSWGIFYSAVCLAGWWALAICITGEASAFEQFVTACAGMAIYLTVPSWMFGIPLVVLLPDARFRTGDDPKKWKEIYSRRMP